MSAQLTPLGEADLTTYMEITRRGVKSWRKITSEVDAFTGDDGVVYHVTRQDADGNPLCVEVELTEAEYLAEVGDQGDAHG